MPYAICNIAYYIWHILRLSGPPVDLGFTDQKVSLALICIVIGLVVHHDFTSILGLKGDFSFHTDKDSTDFIGGSDSIKTDVFYFLGGPVVRFDGGNRVTPFAHAMAGGATTRFEAESVRVVTGGATRSSFETSATDFALAIGGGVDIRVNDWLKIRAAQVDWAPVFLGDRTINVLGSAGVIVPITPEGQRQDNLRFSAGVVF